MSENSYRDPGRMKLFALGIQVRASLLECQEDQRMVALVSRSRKNQTEVIEVANSSLKSEHHSEGVVSRFSI